MNKWKYNQQDFSLENLVNVFEEHSLQWEEEINKQRKEYNDEYKKEHPAFEDGIPFSLTKSLVSMAREIMELKRIYLHDKT